MERINKILSCSTYQKYLNQNNLAEAGRRFCHHNMGHFLDVARIACILNKEEEYGQSKEMIYAAALLHDIGRWKQYGFSAGESDGILEAIRNHRNALIKEEKSLSGLLYRADKLSRPCFACEAEKECDWKKGKKNLKLLI